MNTTDGTYDMLTVRVKQLDHEANPYESGSFILSSDGIRYYSHVFPDPGCEILATTPVRLYPGEPWIDPVADPVAWLRALPFQYHGVYFWCELEEVSLMSDQTVVEFTKSQQRKYIAWIERHRASGYVVSCGGKKPWLLHAATCRHLGEFHTPHALTIARKLCSLYRDELEDAVVKEGREVRNCPDCG